MGSILSCALCPSGHLITFLSGLAFHHSVELALGSMYWHEWAFFNELLSALAGMATALFAEDDRAQDHSMVRSMDLTLTMLTRIDVFFELWVAVSAHDAACGSAPSPFVIDQCFDVRHLLRCTGIFLLTPLASFCWASR